ncbi:MAG TPA: hypothetical protein VKA46_19350 [Gemmataceae bacterium]|nr:hypothetical protein [Gemmataceae bacterium]
MSEITPNRPPLADNQDRLGDKSPSVKPRRPWQTWQVVVLIVLALLVGFAVGAVSLRLTRHPANAQVTKENFSKIKPGMTYDAVQELLGDRGEFPGGGVPTGAPIGQRSIIWYGPGNSRITVTFDAGVVKEKLADHLD